MKKKLEGQMDFNDLNKVYRRKCLITGEEVCNILNAHDVAIEIGEKCEYGCCYSCKNSNTCGACCNTSREIKFKN